MTRYPHTPAAVRLTGLGAMLAAAAWWGWPSVASALSQLGAGGRALVDRDPSAPEIGFDTLLTDLLAVSVAVAYLFLVLSVLAAAAVATVDRRRSTPGSHRPLKPWAVGHRTVASRWIGLVAGVCGLGLAAAPSFASTVHHPVHEDHSRFHGRPSLSGLRLPDLPEPDRARTADAASVVVRPGDSLWRIAEHTLPPGASDTDVAASVLRWYERNRPVIGTDPDVIFPGTQLEQPGGTS